MLLNYFEESIIKNSKLPVEWQSQSSLDELQAFLQLNWEQRTVFYDDGELKSRQQFLGFVGQKGLRTQNYIGTIVFKGQQLNIFPKVFRTDRGDYDTDALDINHLMRNLVCWLEYCSKIDYPYINITSELDDTNNLRDLFVALYIRYVKGALDRGLFYRYEDKDEDISTIKGKFDIKDYFTRKIPAGQTDKFHCTFSEFEFDNTLNRIIKYTCKSLINETSKENQKLIRHILSKLNDVSDVRCTPNDCDTVRLSRLNKNYSVILSMSKMFLLNKTSTYNMDNSEAFCFLFPTEILFEGFIGGFMQSVLEGKAKVKLQASDMSVFSDVLFAGKSFGKSHRMKHDILVEHLQKGIFILDTKYKEIERFEGNDDILTLVNKEVSSGDIYQVITYAHTRGISDVYLLYPLYRYEDIEPDAPVGVNTSVNSDQPINVHLLRLPFVFEDDIENTKSQLAKVINDIFDLKY